MAMEKELTPLRASLRDHYLADEPSAVRRLIELAALDPAARKRVSADAAALVRKVRSSGDPGLMEVMLAEYGLSTEEGIALMCLAEALLRVPDAETVDDLIHDKIVPHDWAAHLGDSGSIFVNASTWALMLTGRVLDDAGDPGMVGALRGAVKRVGEPVVRVAVGRAMREMGAQFVLGRDITEAMRRGLSMEKRGYTYSYDMLGEAARTEADAMRYHGAYAQAIAAIARHADSDDIRTNPGISVKLSALHPRYEYSQRDHVVPILIDRVLMLARAARDAGLGFNIDAEEADRLDLSLDIIEGVLGDPSLAGWDGFGVVVQAYGPRAAPALDWLYALTTRLDRRIMVRLVKGAYWDTEIKRAQVLGLKGFPVFTRKAHTDVSYIACARKLLNMADRIYPQFATHNAHSAAAILHMAPNREIFEFQRLHGMGETLHDLLLCDAGARCRIYAPVGAHRDLLAYLVRRLLENGANSSFVNQIVDEEVAPETIAVDPFEIAEAHDGAANPAIARPPELYGSSRSNAKGFDITDPLTVAVVEQARAGFAAPYHWQAAPAETSGDVERQARPVRNPARPLDIVGHVIDTDPATLDDMVVRADRAFATWSSVSVGERAAILRQIADLYEVHAEEFFALCAREAGKTWLDAVAELREAVDFLRYYAANAADAERDSTARGVIVCISPWNFPLAIFTGQIAAALVTGNSVIAKPAEQTCLIAALAVRLMHQAGVPAEALQLAPGDGESVGAPLASDRRIAGVCFTGSIQAARSIERGLARNRPDGMLIAETGGLNAMLVDSTALPEQAVRDILASAFQSAGQRCSALRVLYVQRDVEARVLEMLFGAMDALRLGDPWSLSTDIGPVIDEAARDELRGCIEAMEAQGRVLKKLDVPAEGLFVPPTVIRVRGIDELEKEMFGPILHVARFSGEDIDGVLDAINERGYGLTLGIHSRIDARVQRVVDRAHVGNLYVNRNQIGAIVGCQPFGGEGLSGTGPKAGGPHYLARFRRPVEPARAPDPSRDSAPPVRAAEIGAALRGLDASAWQRRSDRADLLARLLDGEGLDALAACRDLETGPVDLPGPTGESNRYWLAPRGRVLCLGPDPDSLRAQVVQALALGNAVVAVAPAARTRLAALQRADIPFKLVDGRASPEDVGELAIDALAFAGDATGFRRALAAQDKAITPVIAECLAPMAYLHERAVCIDTTAAGGNATLLASAA